MNLNQLTYVCLIPVLYTLMFTVLLLRRPTLAEAPRHRVPVPRPTPIMPQTASGTTARRRRRGHVKTVRLRRRRFAMDVLHVGPQHTMVDVDIVRFRLQHPGHVFARHLAPPRASLRRNSIANDRGGQSLPLQLLKFPAGVFVSTCTTCEAATKTVENSSQKLVFKAKQARGLFRTKTGENFADKSQIRSKRLP